MSVELPSLDPITEDEETIEEPEEDKITKLRTLKTKPKQEKTTEEQAKELINKLIELVLTSDNKEELGEFAAYNILINCLNKKEIITLCETIKLNQLLGEEETTIE